jgi:hypothetical protein
MSLLDQKHRNPIEHVEVNYSTHLDEHDEGKAHILQHSDQSSDEALQA